MSEQTDLLGDPIKDEPIVTADAKEPDTKERKKRARGVVRHDYDGDKYSIELRLNGLTIRRLRKKFKARKSINDLIDLFVGQEHLNFDGNPAPEPSHSETVEALCELIANLEMDDVPVGFAGLALKHATEVAERNHPEAMKAARGN